MLHDLYILCLCVQIIYRTALDHSHHCLYSILALSNASKDDKFSSSGHVSGKSSGRTSRLSRKGGSGRSVDEVSYQLPSFVVISMCTCMYSKYCSTVGVLLCKWHLFTIVAIPSLEDSYSCIMAIMCMLNESVSFPLRTK